MAVTRPASNANRLSISPFAHPDAEVIDLSARIVANDADSWKLAEPYFYDTRPCPPDIVAKQERISRQFHRLRTRLGTMRAFTVAGWQAKARAVMVSLSPDGEKPDSGSDEYLAWSLCRDLLNGAA